MKRTYGISLNDTFFTPRPLNFVIRQINQNYSKTTIAKSIQLQSDANTSLKLDIIDSYSKY